MEPLGPNDILAYLNFNVFAWEQDYLGCPRSFYDKCCGKMGGGRTPFFQIEIYQL